MDTINEIFEEPQIINGFENSVISYKKVAAGLDFPEEQSKIDWSNKYIRLLLSTDKQMVGNLLVYREYQEFKLYIKKVLRFLLKGIKAKAFSIEDAVNKGKYSNFSFVFDTLPYIPKLFISERENAFCVSEVKLGAERTTIKFPKFYKEYNILELALIAQDRDVITEIVSKGFENITSDSVVLPFLHWDNNVDDGITYIFGYETIIFKNRLSHYLQKAENQCKQQNSPGVSQNKGIYNLNTGEYVQPRDGIFYIDDFR